MSYGTEEDYSEAEMTREETQRVSILLPYYDLKKQLADPHSALSSIIDAAKVSAISANKALINCDPTKTDIVRILQWRCRRFWSLVGFIELTLENGAEAIEDLDADQQAEMERLLGGDDQQSKDV